jgi:chloramphenicol 3-O phosphotransferase
MYCSPWIKGFHASIAANAFSGVAVIVDYIFHEKDWLLEGLSALQHNTIYCVGVRCDIDTLKGREKRRAGQFPGMVEFQSRRVHLYSENDIEIETTPAN